ncbi:MAG: dolichyl-diphosphooligosaccharide--protein glycosyltransferase subunit [archaeon]|nr:dolichyl-diphosphooligosaccharide--protein glycosyltransferase subunit [archaeon]
MKAGIIFLIIQIILLVNAQLGPHRYAQLKRTLVLLDDMHRRDLHSMFFDQLYAMGFEVDFRVLDDSNISLTGFGEYLYTNIIIMAPSLTDEEVKKTAFSIPEMLKFFDSGHDIMILGDKTTNTYVRKLANEFGVDFDDYNSLVRDSIVTHSLKDKLNPSLVEMRNDEIVVSNNLVKIPIITGSVFGKNILYEGIGMDVDPANNYVFPILKGISTMYSSNPSTNDYYANGERIKLVSAYQGRNNRRVIISGSMNMCSDMFYYLSNTDSNNSDMTKSPNGKFCQELLNWNFQKTGVLKFENIRHRRKSDGVTLEKYRIKDELEYFIDIYEYDNKKNTWKPYLTNDIQVEYNMMNPYFINQLRFIDQSKPTYYVQFKAPEKFGVFKFVIDYKRPGYSYIITETKVPLRPYYHNEYPRFLPCAYPYYLSVFISMFSFILFSVLFIYGKNTKKE